MFTIEMFNTLTAAIATGTYSVQYGNKMVTYKSLDEMLRIRGLMAAELGLLPSTKDSRTYGEFSKGLK